ncbi:hypothetical protein PAXRUDRAFT_22538 [Paxillus rubicundulus Ve08.2h10]|uniref:Uncharacterized protein n=1 Tax=Paxillus rubicundulus Ve08.2h10 TaxID=930991 RepID=A0A0D0D594_9AGAM|nr:hypothetical protein PAXRUDRAFT_22538 [Paxillus rubicundulus Ve08.2h10]
MAIRGTRWRENMMNPLNKPWILEEIELEGGEMAGEEDRTQHFDSHASSK